LSKEKLDKEKKDAVAAVSNSTGIKAQDTLAPQKGKKSPSISPTPSPPPGEAKQEAVENQSLSDDQMEKKIQLLMEEYYNIRDVNEAMACVKDLHSPDKHNLVVYHAVNGSLEKNEKDRELVARLLKKMLHEKLITTEDYFKGMSEIIEFADDMAIDIPQLWTYLGRIVGIVVSGGSVTARQLKDALVVCQDFPRAATFAVRLVQTLEEEKVR
jgi:translation initiation factor 4G